MTNSPPFDRKHPLIALAVVLALVFVFGSACLIMAIAAWSCVSSNSCSELNGLSHVVTAWAGAIIGGVVAHLLGGRRDVL
jgi:hypothetical protein